MAGNLIQVGADGKVRVKTNGVGNAGIVVAGVDDSCCCAAGPPCTGICETTKSLYTLTTSGVSLQCDIARQITSGDPNGTWDVPYTGLSGGYPRWQLIVPNYFVVRQFNTSYPLCSGPYTDFTYDLIAALQCSAGRFVASVSVNGFLNTVARAYIYGCPTGTWGVEYGPVPPILGYGGTITVS
jgi:hypothetical protein